jgi:hypothetical protein
MIRLTRNMEDVIQLINIEKSAWCNAYRKYYCEGCPLKRYFHAPCDCTIDYVMENTGVLSAAIVEPKLDSTRKFMDTLELENWAWDLDNCLSLSNDELLEKLENTYYDVEEEWKKTKGKCWKQCHLKGDLKEIIENGYTPCLLCRLWKSVNWK